MENKFDHIISQKLENVQPTMPKDAWKVFQDKLDSAAKEQSSENNAASEASQADVSSSFDQIIAQKLHALELGINTKQDSWEDFEKKLTNSRPVKDYTASDFDQLIAQNLEHNYPAYNPEHWQILKNRLDQITLINAKIATYKMGEILVLLVLWLFIGNVDTIGLKDGAETEVEKPVNKSNAIAEKPSIDNKISIESIIGSQSADDQKIRSDIEIAILAKPLPRIVNSIQPDPIEKIELVEMVGPSKLSGSNFPPDSGENFVAVPLLSNKSERLLLTELDRKNLLAEAIARTLEGNGRYSLIGSTDFLSLPINKYADPDLGLPKTVSISPAKVGMSVSMFGALDYNRIITKDIKEYGLRAFDRYEAGYSGGFLVEFKKGKLGLQLGGIYSAKKIRPKQITHLGSFVDGFPGELLEEYDFNTINVPLNITYDILNSNKWRLYVLGGMSLQVVYEANYYVVLDLSESIGIGTLGGGLGVISTANTKSRLDDIKFPPGLFQNGTLRETGYLSTNVGLGLERLILEDRWSVFVQPTYHHGLIYFNEGLGPFKDRIRTMSLFTGVRVKLIK